MKIACVIPSRYGSTRLPGKPLADIAGQPMIRRVYSQVSKAKRPDAVLVATDDQRVYDAVVAFGGQVIMTDASHPTGTDRLAEVARKCPEYDVIINVQGDEPLIEPSLIDELAAYFEEPNHGPMATVASTLHESEYNDPAAVKVVCNCKNEALYFSRSLIPYPRNAGVAPLKHIGIYGYTRDFILRYSAMAPTPLEETESLEQLRVLENGYTIRVIQTDYSFIGVDTPEDLEAVNKIFAAKGELE